MINSKTLRHEISAILAIGLATVAISPAAYADQAEDESADKPRTALGDIVVTGSRIRRTQAQDAVVPVTSLQVEELVDQGDINLGDALNDLPALRSTFSQGNSTRFIGTAGLNLLDLRGLGIDRTLVLVNNRRHVTTSPGDNLVDVHTIPQDLIERVDVVTGGNSAIYGSDAVAGVVNFITRRDYEGLKIKGQFGTSSESDRDTDFIAATWGKNFGDGRGNVAINVEWGKTDPLFFHERDDLTGAFSGRSQFNLAEITTGEGVNNTDGIPDNQFFSGVFNATISDGGLPSVNASAAPFLPSGAPNPIFCGNLAEPARSQRCLPNNQPRVFSFDASGALVQTIPGIDFRPFGSNNFSIDSNAGVLSSLRNTGHLAAGLERYSANIYSHFQITEAFTPFLEAKFVHINATQEGQPSFWQGSIPGFFGGGSNLRCNNPFLGAPALAQLQVLGRCANPAVDTFTMSRFNVDFGGRGELHDRDIYRVVAGVEGDFNDDWHYEVALNYGHLKTKLRSLNNLVLFDLNGNDDGFLLALNAVTNGAGNIVCAVNADADPLNDRPDCVPINVFGVGAPSQAALDFVNTTARRDEKAEQLVASAYMSGDLSQLFELPAGPIGFAFGVEYREEKAESVFDELTAFGGTFLNAIQPFLPPDLTVKDVFGELRVPLLAGIPGIHELTVETSARISDYNTATGEVDAHNVGLIYSPYSDLRFRGSFSTSVRAPTQSDLFSPFSQNFAFVQDPCDVLFINNDPDRAANCAAHGVPVGFVNTTARTQTQGLLQGGNPDLVEEQGESWTYGLVFTPGFLPGIALAIDYYEIDVDNLIATLTAQTILNECYNADGGVDNQYCTTVTRLPNFEFDDPMLVASGFNFARQTTRGVDVDLSYNTVLNNGHRINSRFIGTRVFEVNNYTNPANPSAPNRQLSELGDPKTAFNVNFGYGIGDFDVKYNLRYIGKQTIGLYEAQHSFDGNPPTNADQFPRVYYPEVEYHSLHVEYNLTDNLQLYGGVDNLTDEAPPLGLLGTGAGDPFDAIGRFFYMGATVEL